MGTGCILLLRMETFRIDCALQDQPTYAEVAHWSNSDFYFLSNENCIGSCTHFFPISETKKNRTGSGNRQLPIISRFTYVNFQTAYWYFFTWKHDFNFSNEWHHVFRKITKSDSTGTGAREYLPETGKNVQRCCSCNQSARNPRHMHSTF